MLQNPSKQNCVISAVGKDSLHKQWLHKYQNFDVHLIVYDNSYPLFKNDTAYICEDKGYKLKLVYRYLKRYSHYLHHYKYFFIPDDDILIDRQSIETLFRLMEYYSLSIAQPALINSYYNHEITTKDRFTKLRYTNFVEMMIPCFSRETLHKILFTFDENACGWGADIHWANLINFTGKEMAIIDDVTAIHTRPAQSYSEHNVKEYEYYKQKHQVIKGFKEYGYILKKHNHKKREFRQLLTREEFRFLEKYLSIKINKLLNSTRFINNLGLLSGLTGVSFILINYHKLTSKRRYQTDAFNLLDFTKNNLYRIKDDISFSKGLSGIAWFIYFLSKNKYIENNTHEILYEISEKIDSEDFSRYVNYSLRDGLIGFVLYYLSRINNCSSPAKDIENVSETIKLIKSKISSNLEKIPSINLVSNNIDEFISSLIFYNESNIDLVYMKDIPVAQCRISENDYKLNIRYEDFYINMLRLYITFIICNANNDSPKAIHISDFALRYSSRFLNINNQINIPYKHLVRMSYIYDSFYLLTKKNEFRKLTQSFLRLILKQTDSILSSHHINLNNIEDTMIELFILISLLQ